MMLDYDVGCRMQEVGCWMQDYDVGCRIMMMDWMLDYDVGL